MVHFAFQVQSHHQRQHLSEPMNNQQVEFTVYIDLSIPEVLTTNL